MRSSNSLATSAGRPKSAFRFRNTAAAVPALVWCVGPLQYLNAIPALATLCQAFILALSAARLGRCALGAYI
jgi:hypothetical protein